MEHQLRELLGRTANALRSADEGHFGANDFSAFKSRTESMTDRLIDAMFPRHAGKPIMREQALFEAANHLNAILQALSYDEKRAEAITRALIEALPEIYRVLRTDLFAAYVGDPAAKGVDEIILCYPAFFAIATYRLAHVLYLENVPLLPRVMTEYAHRKTGIDIHPGATIGESFFIDHGTGVVIGETTTIGSGVKIYQHVTLGAKSFDTDADGMPVKGLKRHPDIGDRVVIYAGATILGGETRIGNDCVIGGSVWLTHSVEAGKMVLARTAVMDNTLKRDVMHPILPEDSSML
jgi:serine O-acetyltransferase